MRTLDNQMRIKGNRQRLISICFVGIAVLVFNLAALQAGPAVLLEVAAGKQVRENCIVSMPVPKSMQKHKTLTLFRKDKNIQVPVQIDRSGKTPELVWVLRDKLPKGATRKYRLQPGVSLSGPKTKGVKIDDDGKHLNVKVDGKPVFTYNHATVKAPKRDQSYYDKSGYIHPLYTPSGKVISDDFNPNHAHQHGIMFTWRKIVFEGRKNNGWDQKSKLGKVEHNKVDFFSGGPVFGTITTTIDHVDLTKKTGPVTMLKETWQIRVFALEDQFLFDINSTQNCATDQPVTIDKVHYGGMTLRGYSGWHDDHQYDYLTSEGKNKKNGNQSRPEWVEMFGPIDGDPAGVTILSHPTNFRFPQPVRLHPSMPYFCFAVSAIDSFLIEPGKPYVSRYRFYVHDGDPSAKLDQRLWEDYAEPPAVKIVAE